MAADDVTPASDPRPVVATAAPSNLGMWAFLAILLVAGVWLFSAMSAARLDQGAPRTTVPLNQDAGRIASPPPIAIPDRFLPDPAGDPRYARVLPYPGPGILGARPPLAVVPRGPVAIAPRPLPVIRDNPYDLAPTRVPPATATLPDPFATPPPAALDASEGERVKSVALRNPGLTVPLGTMIKAVLETGLDSTRPGFVRALVQRDVRGFDGSRVLIPRGSRLYGEYQADLLPGQNRALIRWTRLLRPDGVTIALDSPAADPLGRAGIKGKVDSKFFQRFGTALLQSVLDVGVGIATRSASDGVVVAMPGSTTNISGNRSEEVKPVLKVKHGTSISVYVARDLDFSGTDS